MSFPIFPEGPRIVHPSGFISFPEDAASGLIAVTAVPLPGLMLTLRGPASLPVADTDFIPGNHVYVDMQVKMSRALLVGSMNLFSMIDQTATAYFYIAVRPGNNIQMGVTDIEGTTVAETDAVTVPNHSNVRVLAMFDSITGENSFFSVNNMAPDWTTTPVSSWTPWRPSRIDLGVEVSELGLIDFNGTLLMSQMGVSNRQTSSAFDAPNPVWPPPPPWPGPGPGPWPWPWPRPWPRPRPRLDPPPHL